jgi:hypothetical protein
MIVPTPRFIVLVPATAVRARVQSVEAFAGLAISIPVGRLSVNPVKIEKKSWLEELSMVKLKVLLPPRGTELGTKFLENPGRVDTTFKSSVAGPLLPSLEVKAPEVLVCVPTTLLLTLTLTIQLCELATFPLVKIMVPPPSGALTIPSVHVVNALAGLAITTPLGSGSVKAKSTTGAGLKLVMVKISVETLPGPILSGENVLEKPGPAKPALADHGRNIERARNIKRSMFLACFSV